MNPKGSFITFEGVEGAGKSTQIERLADTLRDVGREVVVTREPGGTALGTELRRLAMHFRDPTPSPTTELLLYLADRAQHLSELIVPAIARGDVVLCDRFSASTIVYQGFARGLDIEIISRLDELVRAGNRPSLTVLLDCPVEVGLRRAHGDDRFHEEARGFHERVRRGFLALAHQDPERYLVVDATASADDVHARIRTRVFDHLGVASR